MAEIKEQGVRSGSRALRAGSPSPSLAGRDCEPSSAEMWTFADAVLTAANQLGPELAYLRGQEAAWAAAEEVARAVLRTLNGGVFPQPWKGRESFNFDLDDEMRERLRGLAERTSESGRGFLASANYYGQGHVAVPSKWLLEILTDAGSRHPSASDGEVQGEARNDRTQEVPHA